MSWTTKQRLTVVAVVVLVASVPLVWQLGHVRAERASEETQPTLGDQTVTNRQAANDYDGDGIADGADRCPTRPETDNGFQDGDGCPDIVTTTGAS